MFELAPVLKHRFFDLSGLPLAGGLLYSYVAGSSTPQATYTDEGGLTPNTNPVVLDASGYAPVWMNEAQNYKFILTDSLGVQQWSVDNVKGIAALITAAINTAGALAILNNLSDLNNVATALQNLGISPFTYPTRFNITSGQAASSLSGETLDGSQYTSAIYEFEIQQAIVGYLFTITSGNATAAATYTNNGHTYTVTNTIAAQTKLFCSGALAPLASGTLTKSGGTGDATIAFSAAQATYSIFANGNFQLQFLNGVWQIVKRFDFDSGTAHGLSFSLTQTNSTAQLKVAEGGLGDGLLKIKKQYFIV